LPQLGQKGMRAPFVGCPLAFIKLLLAFQRAGMCWTAGRGWLRTTRAASPSPNPS
jgi:hypothetical protein